MTTIHEHETRRPLDGLGEKPPEPKPTLEDAYIRKPNKYARYEELLMELRRRPIDARDFMPGKW